MEASEEQEHFLEEIGRFNSCFSLVGNRESVTGDQAQAELLHLLEEVDSIQQGNANQSRNHKHSANRKRYAGCSANTH